MIGALEALRQYFVTGETQSYSFRKEQLIRLKNKVLENEENLYQALYADLKKSKEEVWATEIGFFLNELHYTIDHLRINFQLIPHQIVQDLK